MIQRIFFSFGILCKLIPLYRHLQQLGTPAEPWRSCFLLVIQTANNCRHSFQLTRYARTGTIVPIVKQWTFFSLINYVPVGVSMMVFDTVRGADRYAIVPWPGVFHHRRARVPMVSTSARARIRVAFLGTFLPILKAVPPSKRKCVKNRLLNMLTSCFGRSALRSA